MAMALFDPVSITREIEATPFAHARNVVIAYPHFEDWKKLYKPQPLLALGLVPDGQISSSIDFAVQSPLQKYFASPVGQIISTNSRHPVPRRGAYHDRHERWDGMRWTRQRFARDGIAGQVGERPVSDQQRADERCCSVRRSRVVLTPRRWRQVRGVKSAQPGLDKTYPLTTVAKQPDHRGARRKPLKPLRAGMPGDSGVLVVTRVRSTTIMHTRPRVQRASGI